MGEGSGSDRVMEYAAPTRRSRLAVWGMGLGVTALVTSVVGAGFLIGPVAIVVSYLARRALLRDPTRLYGIGYVRMGCTLGTVAFFLSLLVFDLDCGCGGSRELSNRMACAANVRGIMQSLNVYASDDGDAFPVMAYAARGVGKEQLSGDVAAAAKPEEAVPAMYATGSGEEGSALAGVWVLVLERYTSQKQYICKSDPYVTFGAEVQAQEGKWHLNFAKPTEVSYGVAYPWGADGRVGGWWRATEDVSLPLMSDIGPKDGTGQPAANVGWRGPGAVPKEGRVWNSPNHAGDGENVGFADGHAEFVRRPDCGQGGDNIFTVSGVQPRGVNAGIRTERAPFDVVMVPARDLGAGGF